VERSAGAVHAAAGLSDGCGGRLDIEASWALSTPTAPKGAAYHSQNIIFLPIPVPVAAVCSSYTVNYECEELPARAPRRHKPQRCRRCSQLIVE
jgi:hypothetical protein